MTVSIYVGVFIFPREESELKSFCVTHNEMLANSSLLVDTTNKATGYTNKLLAYFKIKLADNSTKQYNLVSSFLSSINEDSKLVREASF